MEKLNQSPFGEEAQAAETAARTEQTEEVPEEQPPRTEGEAAAETEKAELPEEAESQTEPYRVYHSKEEWQQEFDGIIGKRLKDQRKTQEKLAAYEAKLEDIAAIYGTDIDGLEGEMNRMLEDRAYEEGVSPDDLKARLKHDREFARLKQMKQQMEQQESLRRFSDAVTPEIETLKKRNPGLYADLNVESITGNPLFVELLANGYSLEKAYEMLHVDKVKDYVRRSTRATVANNIKARGSRPTEGAGKDAGSGAAKLDIANLTSEELRDIRERVRRGEKITFKT